MLSSASCPPCWTLLLQVLLVSSSGDQLFGEVSIIARPRDDVTLPCRAPGQSPIRAAEWSRPDMTTQYVFFYRDGQADNTFQHPSYKDRVELADSKVKDGNLSLVLKNVMLNDSGTYECRVKQEATKRTTRHVIKSEPISIVKVTVIQSRGAFEPIGAGGHLVGHVGLVVGLVVMAVI